ncbi:MAG: YIP1 family protein [Bacteroidota bacterium]
MIWLIIESPSQAFKKIIIAEHKNFVLVLSLFLGIGAMFALMWADKSGNSFDNLFPLLLFGTFIGLVIAIPLFFLLAGVTYGAAAIAGGKASFKETYGIIGWSLVPVMLSVVFVLPLEMSSMGLVFFSTNPSALEVKPVVASVMLGLDGLFVLWSILLASLGISIAHRFRYITGVALTVVSVCAVSYISVFIYSSFNI